MKKELMKHKFERLSDANKIRHNLGYIISSHTFALENIQLMNLAIFGFLLLLPLIIRHFGSSKIVLMAIVGFSVLVVVSIMLMVSLLNYLKSNKSLEDFLNRKSKK